MKKDISILIFLIFISLLSGFFYYFQINFSTDLIILFLSEKIFFGKWISEGVLPLFNPHMFGGIPFLFDVGMGNLHPFNLFFILPYPFSFSVWIVFSFSLFLIGYYLFFRQFTHTKLFALLLTLILFLSGSGYWRINNPTIFLVIAHYGIVLYFLKDLKHKYSHRFVLAMLLLGLSGHVQFVLYGIILCLLAGLIIYKIPFKNLILPLAVSGLFIGSYFAFSLPLVLDSTRMTTSADYTSMGKLPIQQLLQFLFPFFFGYVKNGSSWNVGPTFVVLISNLFTYFIIILLVKKLFRSRKIEWFILFLLLISSFGFVNFPFFRAPSQIMVLFHIWGVLLISRHEKALLLVIKKLPLTLVGTVGLILSVLSYVFFTSQVFSNIFFELYKLVKKTPPNLFFDQKTVAAIGSLVALHMPIFLLFFICFILLGLIGNHRKLAIPLLIAFVVFEGLYVNYFHNYFIPQDILTQKYQLPMHTQNNTYRTQTVSDVLPYFGFHTYMGNILFRPPFSKEKEFITEEEESSKKYLRYLMSLYPSTWSMTYDINAVQGYNTFVTKDIAGFFKQPSDNYKEEYKAIIDRNSLFGQSEKGLAINGIETSKITLYDPRWEKLGVRYFISDRPLKKYKLLEHKNGRYVYENEWAPPIYRVVKGDVMTAKRPTYQNPNEWHFDISVTEKGSVFEMVMNPGGFVATINGKSVEVQKSTFLLSVPLTHEGKLILRYSPTEHLIETVNKTLNSEL